MKHVGWIIVAIAIALVAWPFVAVPPSSVDAKRLLHGIWLFVGQLHLAPDRNDPVVFDGHDFVCPHCGRQFRWFLKMSDGVEIKIPFPTDQVGVPQFIVSCSRGPQDLDGWYLFNDSTKHFLRNSQVDWETQRRRVE